MVAIGWFVRLIAHAICVSCERPDTLSSVRQRGGIGYCARISVTFNFCVARHTEARSQTRECFIPHSSHFRSQADNIYLFFPFILSLIRDTRVMNGLWRDENNAARPSRHHKEEKREQKSMVRCAGHFLAFTSWIDSRPAIAFGDFVVPLPPEQFNRWPSPVTSISLSFLFRCARCKDTIITFVIPPQRNGSWCATWWPTHFILFEEKPAEGITYSRPASTPPPNFLIGNLPPNIRILRNSHGDSSEISFYYCVQPQRVYWRRRESPHAHTQDAIIASPTFDPLINRYAANTLSHTQSTHTDTRKKTL